MPYQMPHGTETDHWINLPDWGSGWIEQGSSGELKGKGVQTTSWFGQLLPLLVDFSHCVNIDRYATNGKKIQIIKSILVFSNINCVPCCISYECNFVYPQPGLEPPSHIRSAYNISYNWKENIFLRSVSGEMPVRPVIIFCFMDLLVFFFSCLKGREQITIYNQYPP